MILCSHFFSVGEICSCCVLIEMNGESTFFDYDGDDNGHDDDDTAISSA
jgi:hypothetical protein